MLGRVTNIEIAVSFSEKSITLLAANCRFELKVVYDSSLDRMCGPRSQPLEPTTVANGELMMWLSVDTLIRVAIGGLSYVRLSSLTAAKRTSQKY